MVRFNCANLLISITPDVYFIFSPEGFSANNTAIVGALRTTFTF
ncbi:MAG: carbohydrate porin [Nostoc sp. DedQUE12b]|nr:carbohydrate porin [Nostoc sp. DedQUE12b]MDZ8087924.1 carbohydrate porin [Nostoc sp. DedQUE12b]